MRLYRYFCKDCPEQDSLKLFECSKMNLPTPICKMCGKPMTFEGLI